MSCDPETGLAARPNPAMVELASPELATTFEVVHGAGEHVNCACAEGTQTAAIPTNSRNNIIFRIVLSEYGHL
jgi:hypothetical protein